MALYLEGKPSVDANELSPKEATQMSHEVKYIGMDVHKETIVARALRKLGYEVAITPIKLATAEHAMPMSERIFEGV